MTVNPLFILRICRKCLSKKHLLFVSRHETLTPPSLPLAYPPPPSPIHAASIRPKSEKNRAAIHRLNFPLCCLFIFPPVKRNREIAFNTVNAPAPTPCPATIKRFSRTWADTPSMEAVWTERIPVSGWSSIWRSNAVVKRAGA